MKIKTLSEYLDRLENTSGRNDITEILASLFAETSAEEIDKVVYLLLGILAPSYRGLVFNVAEKMMVEVVGVAYDKEKKEVQKLYKETGDLGVVASKLSDKKSSSLSVVESYNELVKIAKDEGEGSQERKITELAKLLRKLDALSVRYVTRIPVGKLRLGFSDKTIIDALSYLEVGDKTHSKELKRAYEVLPDIGLLAKEVKKKGINKTVASVSPEVGVPVMPMLAQRLNSTSDMIKKMGTVAVEPKFDGVRVLIHWAKEKEGEKPFVRAYTRNLNDVSDMFPELQKLGEYVKAKSLILDSEGIGIDPKTEKIVDFQKTMQRRRKNEIGQASKDIPFRFQLFDIMAKDGKSLMATPYDKRREVLAKTIKKNSLFVIDEYMVTDDPEVIRKEHKKYREDGLEGIIAKKLDAKYVPGRTGWRWVKMKEEEGSVGKLADTVDCVIMGYTRGKGKRAEFGIGQFLAGVQDKKGAIKSITKVGTGLSDEQLTSLAKRLKKLVVKSRPKQYEEVHTDYVPDFWVKPEVVVELAGDDLTVSTKHKAGYALRFPRLVKFRDDKDVNGVTRMTEVVELFKMQ